MSKEILTVEALTDRPVSDGRQTPKDSRYGLDGGSAVQLPCGHVAAEGTASYPETLAGQAEHSGVLSGPCRGSTGKCRFPRTIS